MKAKFTLLLLLVCCLISSAALAQTNNVSKAEALAIAQRQFQGSNVDLMVAIDTMFLQVGAQNPYISPLLWEKGNSIGYERIPFALEDKNIESLSYPEPTTFRAEMDKAGTLARSLATICMI